MHRIAALGILLLAFCQVPLAQGFKEGVHYQRLAQPVGVPGEQIEVIEFFWYGCPHCADFEPYMQTWKKSKPADVKLTLVPAVFREGWKVHARAFYAAEILGVLDVTHGVLFDAMHKQKLKVESAEQIVDIFSKHGVDKNQFLDTMNSFAVETKLRQAVQMIRDFRIQGVPAVGVAGKYLTGGSQAGSYSSLLQVIDHLVELERKNFSPSS